MATNTTKFLRKRAFSKFGHNIKVYENYNQEDKLLVVTQNGPTSTILQLSFGDDGEFSQEQIAICSPSHVEAIVKAVSGVQSLSLTESPQNQVAQNHVDISDLEKIYPNQDAIFKAVPEIHEVIKGVSQVIDVLRPVASCCGISESILKIIDQAIVAYKQVCANDNLAEKLATRFAGLKHPITRLCYFLRQKLHQMKTHRESGQTKDTTTLNAGLVIQDTEHLVERLGEIHQIVKDGMDIIKKWSEKGTRFFGQIKKALSASSFAKEFDGVSVRLAEALTILQQDLIMIQFVKVMTVEIPKPNADAWLQENEEAAVKDIKNLPKKVDEQSHGDKAALESMLKEIGWSSQQMYVELQNVGTKLSQIQESVDQILNHHRTFASILEMLQVTIHDARFKFKNKAAADFWEITLRPVCNNQRVAWNWFNSAVFNEIFGPAGLTWSDFVPISSDLKLRFDRNGDNNLDVYEYDAATQHKTVKEQCEELMLQKKYPARVVQQVTRTTAGPNYPETSAAHKKLLEEISKKSNSVIAIAIQDPSVLYAFSVVPRRLFLPDDYKGNAYEDNPIRHGDAHQSAPHMYVTCLYHLGINANTKLKSFLNIGSGTGYLNNLVGVMQGWTGINHGLEVKRTLLTLSKERSSVFAKLIELKESPVKFYEGNCFSVHLSATYERIYVGAACPRARVKEFFSYIADGGLMMVPVDEGNQQYFTLFMKRGSSVEEKRIFAVNYAALVLP